MTQTKIYGLIGFPVAHSLSPRMHNAAFKHLNINAEYKLFPLQEKEVEPFLKGLKENNIYGLNVTVPYKEKVTPFLNNVSSEAKLIGAVNTIKASDKGLEGFNTDGAGFLRHLTEDLGFDPKAKTIAVIGAGGASRAISVYLAKSKPKVISIYDIDKTRLSSLVDHLKTNFNGVDIKTAASLEDLRGADLLVNATPLGLKESDPPAAGASLIKSNMLVYDLIYNPQETKLLKLARESGAKAANGLGMLLYQGALAFEIWTAQNAPVEIMRQALIEGGQ